MLVSLMLYSWEAVRDSIQRLQRSYLFVSWLRNRYAKKEFLLLCSLFRFTTHTKESIQEGVVQQVFGTSPKSVLLNMEGLHTIVDLNNPLVFDKLKKKKKELLKMDTWKKCDFNYDIGIMLNNENLYFYKNKDIKFDVFGKNLWSETQFNSTRFKRCKGWG